MAESPAHKLGQLIGIELETAFCEHLQAVADDFGLYLDYQHSRPSRGMNSKVTWKDSFGNRHDLDYVLEDGGTEDRVGVPRAFIETAWRRYTKHSRNKLQEIQGVLCPLEKTYHNYRPFLGVILAGNYTDDALQALKSQGFKILHCPYRTIVQAYANTGVDVSSEENSSERDLREKLSTLEMLSEKDRRHVRNQILELNKDQFASFFAKSRDHLGRCVESVFVITLTGTSNVFDSTQDAIRFLLRDWIPESGSKDVVKFELNVRYSNDDEIRATFQCKEKALSFLRSL